MHSRTPLASGIDTAIVIAFVAIGRRNHEEGTAIADIASTAAPFLIGLFLAWVSMRAWQRPLAAATGIGLWGITLAVGMVLRRVLFDDGTATSFVVVAAIFLGLLVGWRMAFTAISSRPTSAL